MRDAAGRDITDAVQVSFASGSVAPSATVPDPGTWALLGTGLLAIGGVAQRRKRAA